MSRKVYVVLSPATDEHPDKTEYPSVWSAWDSLGFERDRSKPLSLHEANKRLDRIERVIVEVEKL